MKKDLEYLAVAEYHCNEIRITQLEELISQHKLEMKQTQSEERFETAYRACLQERLSYHSSRREQLYREAGSLVNQINRTKKHWYRKFRDFLVQAWSGLKHKISRCFGRFRRFFHKKHV